MTFHPTEAFSAASATSVIFYRSLLWDFKWGFFVVFSWGGEGAVVMAICVKMRIVYDSISIDNIEISRSQRFVASLLANWAKIRKECAF